MSAKELIVNLREYADWCDSNIYEVPITMPDDLRLAADIFENLLENLDV